MKHLNLLLFTVLFSSAFAFVFHSPMKQYEYKSSYKVKSKMPQDKKVEGRAEERAKMLRNQETGKVDAKDWYTALNQIMAMNKGLSARSGSLEWENQGPDQVGGRTRGFIFDKTKEGRVYAGGVSGGIYYSDNLGHNWKPVSDMADSFLVMSIGSMIQSKDGDIYAGTGEYWGNSPNGSFGSQFYGNGIYKKEANSEIWTLLRSTTNNSLTNATHDGNFEQVIDMACDLQDNEKVYAATTKGLFISTNGGTTWTKNTAGPSTPVAQIKIASDGTLYAAWGGKVWKSKDNAATWTDLIKTQNAYVSESNQHVRLAISATNPDKLYACGITGSSDLKYVIKTEDGGTTWTFLGKGDVSFNPLCNDIDGQRACQGWYDLALACHPKNDDLLFLGGAASMYSWSKQYGWLQMTYGYAPGVLGVNQVHADMHDFVFHPTNTDTMVCVNDGGIYMSYNSTKSFPNVTWTPTYNRYNVTQFYDMSVNKYGELIGGAQDNGTQFLTLRGANSNVTFEISGGDGFDSDISAAENYMVAFTTVYNGSLSRTDDLTTDRKSIASGCAATGGKMSNVGFNTKIHLAESVIKVDETLDTVEFSFLFSFDALGSYSVSPNAYNIKEQTTWTTPFNPGVGQILSAHQTPNLSHIYICGANGVKRSTKFTSTTFTPNLTAASQPCLNPMSTQLAWTSVTGTSGAIGDIYVDQVDGNRAVAVAIGFGGTAKVFFTTNGTSFSPKQGNLPIMPVYSCAINPEDPKHVVVATEFGIWETMDIEATSPVWVESNTNIGRVPVMKLRVMKLRVDECPMLYAATHGRGFFRTPFPFKGTCDYTKKSRPGSSAVNQIANMSIQFNIYPNPTSDIVNVKFNSKVLGNYYLTVYDINGKLVKKMNYKAMAGDNILSTDISALENGKYIVRLEDNNSVIGGKILVKN